MRLGAAVRWVTTNGWSRSLKEGGAGQSLAREREARNTGRTAASEFGELVNAEHLDVADGTALLLRVQKCELRLE